MRESLFETLIGVLVVAVAGVFLARSYCAMGTPIRADA